MKTIRLATPQDATEMLALYRPYIEESEISFELVTPSLGEFQARIAEKMEKFPWIVCESEGRIVGYAYAGTYRSRRAYDWSVESSVYVLQGFHGQGIGRALYERLFHLLKRQGVVNVVAVLTLPNSASEAMHERLGFEKVAVLKDIAFKNGRWCSIGYWQLTLQKPERPEALRSYR
jgi:L-amino acid N-acyltransferase YncA